MTIEEILNPITEEELKKFNATLTKSREQRNREQANQKDQNRYDHDQEHDSAITMDDDDDDQSSDMDDSESDGNGGGQSSQSSPPRDSESPSTEKFKVGTTSYKVERILLKGRKVVAQLPDFGNRKLDFHQVERCLSEILSRLADIRIKKKTVNQITAAVTFQALKKLGRETSLTEIIKILKAMDKSDSLSRRSKINYSKNNSEMMGITCLIASLDSKATEPTTQQQEQQHQPSTPTPTPTPSKAMKDLTKSLCESLHLGSEVEKLAWRYSALSEKPSLASRHISSIAASAIFHAARKLHVDLTLTRLSSVSKVSPSTIRKANSALADLLQ